MNQARPASEAFKALDASSYDSVTPEFERFTDLVSVPLAARLVGFADLAPGHSVLDVGTGTGVVALQAARTVGINGRVIGVDLSDAMLAAARRKAAEADVSDRVEFHKMDAEALEIEARCFDRVLSLFALLHFPDPLHALKEMFRVLRPGGRLVVAVGSGPPWLSVRGLVHGSRRVSELLLELQGRRLCAPGFLNSLVEKYIPPNRDAEETVLPRKHHNRARSVAALVRGAGFTAVRSDWHRHQSIADTPEEFWDLQRTFSSIARKRLVKAASEEIDRLRQEFFRTCRNVQARGGTLVYPFAAFYITGRRPSV